MCLSTVTEVVKKPTNKEVWAWKVFVRLRNPRRLDFSWRFGEVVQDAWMKAAGQWNDEPYYRLGFHCFTTRAGALRYRDVKDGEVTVRVRVRRVVAYGIQNHDDAIVAREMFIPRGKP